MKKTKKILITVASIILFLTLGIIIYYNYFYDPNALNITEKKWLDDNKSSIVSFNMDNELNVFSSSGDGVFYNFLDDFAKEYNVNIDKNIVPNNTNGLGFVNSKDYTSKDLLFYVDHYVIVGKNNDIITSMDDIKDAYVGGLPEGISRVTDAYNVSAKFTTYKTKTELLDGFKTDKVKYMIVPLNEYIDTIITEDYKIEYHLNDLVNYYYLKLGNDEILNSIVNKYYNEWSSTNLKNSIYTNNYNLFISKLGLSAVETDTLTNKTYTYGFVSSTPYQTLNSSKYGGIIISYLEDFSKFSNVDFVYTKYKTNEDLINAYNQKEVNLIFNNTILNSNDYLIPTDINIKYYIISPLTNNIDYASLKEITREPIYVIDKTPIANYLSSIKNIDLKTLDNEKDLIKQSKKGSLIAIDSYSYDYLVNKKIKDYHISYNGFVNTNYSFKYAKSNDTFFKLFSTYINYINPNEMINNGYLTYREAESSGNIIATIAKYILLIVSIGALITGIVIASKKHLKLNTKIKKDEKLKFVDMLTSLKNRNYLNEKINVWNQNTIYPQAIIVIDLNNIKYLNDTFGHEEGDKQIMAAANVLHQTQLDNTEIMRTDGNEFTIYLVGYNEKQVINYMKKLVKEFNDLPYEYGAAFGFSMIVDDLKLLDDAINEATIKMRENKEIEAHDEEADN